ncbi:MAG: mandelate racemase/muconate lactonizing enzyme family protein [Chloroflexota bacterium]|nr:mandelate racemase/muconate lactonizing enzyme family protein [Chloroflexota bacterium]
MAIASLEVFALSAELRPPRGPSILTYSQRETLLVKVSTEQGLVGWGETYRVAGVEAAIREVLAPMLRGRDPLALRSLHAEMQRATFNNGFAVGAVDLALEDLRGKALGVPVHVLHGGALRQRVEAYASLPGYFDDRAPEEHWVDEACALTDRGFKALKLRIGRFPPRRELPILERVRAAVGGEVRLMADGNAAYSPALAMEVGRALADLGFAWLEEPTPQTGYAGYPELRQKLPLPLAGGEALHSRQAACETLERGCFDIIQPDVSICGGIGECLFIGEAAHTAAVRCVPHCWGGGPMLAASLQVAALLPEPSRLRGVDAPLLEYDVTDNPFRTELLLGDPFALRGGMVEVPRAAGLGVEIDEQLLRRYGAQCG